MYKMVEEITKETWGKCGITTVKHYSEKENIIGLWHRMSDVKRQIGHSNIADVALKIKQKTLQEKKIKIQSIFWRWRGYFYYWKAHMWYNWAF